MGAISRRPALLGCVKDQASTVWAMRNVGNSSDAQEVHDMSVQSKKRCQGEVEGAHNASRAVFDQNRKGRRYGGGPEMGRMTGQEEGARKRGKKRFMEPPPLFCPQVTVEA